MEEARYSERRFLAAGLAVSLLLHVLVAVALVTNFQLSVPEPPINPIEVELVPETEPQTEEAEIPEPEEVQPEEAEPEAPVPAPLPAEQAEAQEPPAPSEAPVMQTVEEFGEEDTGPQAPEEETAEKEAAAEEEVAAEAARGSADVSDEPPPQEPEPARPGEQDLAETTADEAPEPEETPELPSGAETEAEAGVADEQAEEGAVEGEAPAADFGTVGPIVTAVLPAPKPARPSAPPATEEAESPNGGGGAAAGMLSARELFSDDILSDPRARTAMRGMPPGERLNLLCMTELRAQLTVTSPQPPELLPTFRPRNGNVLEPARAAFRSGGRWYDVAFRCETDSDVTRVQKFDFRIGQPIPPGEWAERGLSGF